MILENTSKSLHNGLNSLYQYGNRSQQVLCCNKNIIYLLLAKLQQQYHLKSGNRNYRSYQTTPPPSLYLYNRQIDTCKRKFCICVLILIFELQHHHHHHHHHLFVMELGHLLAHSGLTYPEVSSDLYDDSFCQLGSSVSLPWVIYFEAFYSHVVSSFSCIPVICPKIVFTVHTVHIYWKYIIIYLSWSWATCWPVPVSRIQKSLQKSTMIPSASWTVVFHYRG